MEVETVEDFEAQLTELLKKGLDLMPVIPLYNRILDCLENAICEKAKQDSEILLARIGENHES